MFSVPLPYSSLYAVVVLSAIFNDLSKTLLVSLTVVPFSSVIVVEPDGFSSLFVSVLKDDLTVSS